MLDDFLTRACLAGIGVALAAGPLGCFVVWRRIAYFGDATAHAAILGVAVSLAFSISTVIGVLIVAVAMAIAVSTLSGRGLAMDTLLGVFAHAGLAVGLVAVSVASPRAVDMDGYLFGELLAVTRTDLAVIWGGAAVVLGLVVLRWSALLIATLSSELARGSGINPEREQLAMTIALAVLVAVSIKVVGALLITAMLIVPAAAARPFFEHAGTHGGGRSPDRRRIGARGPRRLLALGHADRPHRRDPCSAVLHGFILPRGAQAETGRLNELRDGTGPDLNYGTAVENSINELADGLENALDFDALLKDANW